MRYVKMLAIAAIAAAGLIALVGVGTASAADATFTCPAGELCPAGATTNALSEGKVIWDAPFGNIECNLEEIGHITTEEEGGSAGNSDGPLTALKWTNCGGDTVTTLALGRFTIESGGTFKSSGTKVTVIHLGVHCIYETANTVMGTLTSANSTRNATLDISATIPRVGGEGGAFCGSSSPFTASLLYGAPAGIAID